jgi:hypothetical protein
MFWFSAARELLQATRVALAGLELRTFLAVV